MALWDEKKGAAALIMRRMRGSNDYESLKSSNEEMRQVPVKDGAEVQAQSGCEMAAEEMMRAVETKDTGKFKRALDAYLELRELEKPESEMDDD